MHLLLYGDDSALLRDKLAAFKSQFSKMYPDGEVITLYHDDLPELDIMADLLTTDSLFGSKKLFIFKGLIPQLEKKNAQELIPWLHSGGALHTVIYYEEGNLEAQKSEFIQDLQKRTLLDPKYVFFCRKGRGFSHNTNLTTEQKLYLDQVYADDSALAKQEMKKVELLQRAGHPELINQVFSDFQMSLSVFPFIDSIFARDVRKSTSLLKSLLEQGENELMLLTMLINHMKKILFVLDAEDKGGDIDGLLKKMRVHAFVAKKLLQQKRAFTLIQAKMWLANLLQIDLLAKQGKVDPKIALSQFCVSIGT
ncbi:MAG: hypothetical protein HY817_02415 [Candidatus Abawacabacteria bacterium]|nr:hypothetical protein [Candidatus Abawacabacteria bacterium]